MTHAEKAAKIFFDGYNCAQSVFMAFCDLTGFDESTAAMISAPFGGGMGRMREVCGALSGMYMVLGKLYGYDDATDPELKLKLYADVRELGESFKKVHGSVVCREIVKISAENHLEDTPENAKLKALGHNPHCLSCVITASVLIDDYISKHAIKSTEVISQN